MIRTNGFAISAMVLLISLVAPVAASAASPPVAIVDMTYILKNHPRLEQMRAAMKADAEAVQNQVKTESESINSLMQKLNDFKKGTDAYKNLTEEITKKRADLQATTQLQKGEFIDREAKMLYGVYQEVQRETQLYCDANGITLALRFNGEEADQNSPQDVVNQLNQIVIYYQKPIDITPYVLKSILARGAAAGGPRAPLPVGQRPAAPAVPGRR